MAQQAKAPATKAEDLRSIPGTYKMERKNWVHQSIFWPPQVCQDTCTLSSYVIHIHNIIDFFNLKNKVLKFIPILSALAETGWLSQQQPVQLGHHCSDPLNSVLNFIWEIRGHPNPLKAELLCFCDVSPALDEISILLVIKGETQETMDS